MREDEPLANPSRRNDHPEPSQAQHRSEEEEERASGGEEKEECLPEFGEVCLVVAVGLQDFDDFLVAVAVRAS